MVLRFNYRTVAMACQIRLGCRTALHWLSCQGDNTSPFVERYGKVADVKVVRRGLSLRLDNGKAVTWCMTSAMADLLLQLCGMVHHTDMDTVDTDDVMFMCSLNKKGLALLYRVCVVFPRRAWWYATCEHQHGMFAVGLFQEMV